MNEAERLAKMLAEEGAIPEFELTNAAVELRRLSAINAELVFALTGLLADIVEYQTINKLGGENNHWQVISRAALEKAKQ